MWLTRGTAMLFFPLPQYLWQLTSVSIAWNYTKINRQNTYIRHLLHSVCVHIAHLLALLHCSSYNFLDLHILVTIRWNYTKLNARNIYHMKISWFNFGVRISREILQYPIFIIIFSKNIALCNAFSSN